VHEELMAVVTIIIIRRMADFSSHLLFLPLAKYVLATAVPIRRNLRLEECGDDQCRK